MVYRLHVVAPRGGGPGMSVDMRQRAIDVLDVELQRAYLKHGRLPWGRHEFYAILKEEVDELWDAIKRDEPDMNVVAEAMEVAAMCFRYIETGDRYRGELTLALALVGDAKEAKLERLRAERLAAIEAREAVERERSSFTPAQ
jgi:hypothetical protein